MENQPMFNPEHKIKKFDIAEAINKPHSINLEIRKLKRKLFDKNNPPDEEEKIIIKDDYRRLKNERIKVRQLLLEHYRLCGPGQRKKILLMEKKKLSEKRDDYESFLKEAPSPEQEVKLEKAKDDWEFVNDFYQLIKFGDKRDDEVPEAVYDTFIEYDDKENDKYKKYWEDITIEEEDDGVTFEGLNK